MKTFVEVDGKSYPGMFVQERALHYSGQYGFFSYLSANIDNCYISVSKWDFDGNQTSELDLRTGLQQEIVSREIRKMDGKINE